MSQSSHVPDRENFLPLLKEAFSDNRPFEYRSVPDSRSLYIHSETVTVLIEVLEWLDDGYREYFLDLIPHDVTQLTMKCWEIKIDPFRHKYMLRIREPKSVDYQQYEFGFMKEIRRYDAFN